MNSLRLGVNIDHVATLRNARGGGHPCPIRAALAAMDAGADGITAHLREDRRHIRDADLVRLKAEVPLPLNMEMAATNEMFEIATQIRPNACCLVPEKRAELTTEGGLDVAGNLAFLTDYTKALQSLNIRVSLFIDPTPAQVEAAHAAGADIVELHTGTYAESGANSSELARIKHAATLAHTLGLEVHAGHGLNFENVTGIARISEMVELNIGHFLMGEALFVGMKEAVQQMKNLMHNARIPLAFTRQGNEQSEAAQAGGRGGHLPPPDVL